MRQPLSVSVVVTSYNYRAYVTEAIDSALSQTLKPKRVCVVEDGSTDGSMDLLSARYGNDSRVEIHAQNNAGQLSAFANGAARCASEDLIAFLDADDVWETGHLDAVCSVFAERPSVDFVYTNMRYFGSRDGLYHASDRSRDDGISTIQTCYAPIWRGSPTSAIVMRSELALRVLDVTNEMLRDWRTRADDCLVFGADLLGAHKFYLGQPLARYRAHNGNVWLGQKIEPHEEMRYRLRKIRLLAFYRSKACLNPAGSAEHLAHLKREFLSKPQPTPKELKVCLSLLKRLPIPWWRQWRIGQQMRRHFRATRAAT